MKVLLIGGGGREHAIAWKLAQSSRVDEIIMAPGNAGMAQLGRCIKVGSSPAELLMLAQSEQVDLTVVGPEAPLVAGIVDHFEAAGLRIVGPNSAAAQLEGSKSFSKAFMKRHNIPTATHESFTDTLLALEYLEQVGTPIVIKDSNLAAGKGVTVSLDKEDAMQAASNILEAPEGGEVVIEDFLTGQEVSFLIFTDGEAALPMPLAQDYKQAFDGDQGPMTGGMGTIAPAALLTGTQVEQVMKSIVEPTLLGLKKEGIGYKGVLFIGLMVTEKGILVLEYNVRFGDPETQVVLPLLQTDLLDVFEAIIDSRLNELVLEWSAQKAACVVMASPGYPGAYPRGLPLAIPDDLASNVTVFHAGTVLEDGRFKTSGGRVLGVTALAADIETALTDSYEAVRRIDFPRAHYRRDIGRRLLKQSW